MQRKLRQGAILVLVAVLLITHAVRAVAGTKGPSITVSTYEELVEALVAAEDGDTISITGTFTITQGSPLGDYDKSITIQSGGGRIVFDADNLEVRNICFDASGFSSGSFLTVKSNTTFTDCIFQNAERSGAYVSYGCVSEFVGCSFSDNSSFYGGHVYVGMNTTAHFSDCTFTGGVGHYKGGAIYLDGSTSIVTLDNCKLVGNSSDMGGAISSAGYVIIRNSEIRENTARVGGGIYSHASLDVINTLIWNNSASYLGDDIANMASCNIITTEEGYNNWLESYGLRYVGWERSYGEDDTEEYLKLLTAPIEPEEPTNPDPEDEDGDSTDPDPSNPEDPADPEPVDPTDPEDGGDPEPPEDEGGDADPEPTDPPTTDPEDNGNEGGGTDKDPEPSPPAGSEGDTNNSSSDNSYTDNSSSRSDSSRQTENSNNTTNTYNYYQTEADKGSTAAPIAPQSGSAPITVNVTVPEQETAQRASNEPSQEQATQTGTEAPATQAAPPQNIHIEGEGVNVIYDYSADGISISISSNNTAQELPEAADEAMLVNAYTIPEQTPTEAPSGSVSWVEYATLILLAVLVFGELKDKFKKKA